MAKVNLENITINNYYSKNWKLSELGTNETNDIKDTNYKINRPKYLYLMSNYSKLLSQEFVFVRVDLYEVNGNVYLGELTFAPLNGFKNVKIMNNSSKNIYAYWTKI